MNAKLPSSLIKLFDLTGENWRDDSVEECSTFDPIGLILLTPPENFGYWCTPENSLTFATTGGDGVHFGLVSMDAGYTDFSPVVMTVPMCDTPNLIVGANLREFLALGSRFGYFALEQLIYDRSGTIEELLKFRFDPESSLYERELLGLISKEFCVEPWQKVEKRLLELDEYLNLLILPEGDQSA